MEPWRYVCPSDGRPWGGTLGITVEGAEMGPTLHLPLCHRRPHPDLCSCSPDQKTDCNSSGCCSSPLAWGLPCSLPLLLRTLPGVLRTRVPAASAGSLDQSQAKQLLCLPFPRRLSKELAEGVGVGAQRMVKKPGPSRTGGTPAPHTMQGLRGAVLAGDMSRGWKLRSAPEIRRFELI